MEADKLTRIYLKMRAAKAELTKNYEAEKARIEKDMETVEGLLLGTLNAVGAQSLRTGFGTAYIEKVIKPNCTDWNAYHTWMAQTGSFAGVEKRVGKQFIVDYMKENDNDLPPGIAVHRENVVRVRVSNE